MEIDLVLQGMSGLAAMVFYVGMLYLSFVWMRSLRRRAAVVFFWAVASQLLVLGLMVAMSVFMKLFGYSLMSWTGGGSVDWVGVGSSVLEGGLVACGLVAAVAFLMTTGRERGTPGQSE